jgi:hypothetical protein
MVRAACWVAIFLFLLWFTVKSCWRTLPKNEGGPKEIVWIRPLGGRFCQHASAGVGIIHFETQRSRTD